MSELRTQALEIALAVAQAQRNEQAERCINLAVELELSKREVTALKAEIQKLTVPTDSETVTLTTKD